MIQSFYRKRKKKEKEGIILTLSRLEPSLWNFPRGIYNYVKFRNEKRIDLDS